MESETWFLPQESDLESQRALQNQNNVQKKTGLWLEGWSNDKKKEPTVRKINLG